MLKLSRSMVVMCRPPLAQCTRDQVNTVFASSESSSISTDQGHVVKMPDVRRILSPIHALDQSVNSVFTIFQTIFRWKTKVYESLGCALEM